jgi:small Trp-rich protein
MYFLGIGIILLALKYLEKGPVAAWDWWIVLSPFALAAAVGVGRLVGYTKKAVEKGARKQARIDKNSRWESSPGGVPDRPTRRSRACA